jgi:hypothetical protein
MNLQLLSGKARKGTLEVEHLLKIGASNPPGLAEAVQRLSDELQWPRFRPIGGGALKVPLADWADVVIAYARFGLAGLEPLLSRARYASLVLALLIEIRSSEAVEALLQLFHQTVQAPGSNLERSLEVASAVNLLLSFKNPPSISGEQETRLRGFLHQLLGQHLTEAQRATVICALRGVGNSETLDLLRSMADFNYSYAGLKASAIRAVRKRGNAA